MVCPRSKLVAVLRLTYEEAAEAADQSLLPGQRRAVRAHRLLRALAERLGPLRLQLASTTASKSDETQSILLPPTALLPMLPWRKRGRSDFCDEGPNMQGVILTPRRRLAASIDMASAEHCNPDFGSQVLGHPRRRCCLSPLALLFWAKRNKSSGGPGCHPTP